MPIIGSSLFSIGTFLLFNSVLNYLGDAYPDYAASVLAGNDFMRSSFGAGFPLFATAMYKNEGVGWASSILGFLAIVFIPIPFILYKVGCAFPPVKKALLTSNSMAKDFENCQNTRGKIFDRSESRVGDRNLDRPYRHFHESCLSKSRNLTSALNCSENRSSITHFP